MPISITFQRAGGGDPLSFVLQAKTAIQTTTADLLAVGLVWRTRIVERTAAGQDASGASFAPYSVRGPYYYTPTSQARGVSPVKQKEAVKRLLRKVTGSSKPPAIGYGSGAPHPSRTGRSIVFPGGYAQFKSWLGRLGVDLTGPRAPHMMQSIYVRTGGAELSPGSSSGSGSASPANSMTVGIYGEPAGRAAGHNNGNPSRHLPQRRFMDVDKSMEAQAVKLLEAFIHARLNA